MPTIDLGSALRAPSGHGVAPGELPPRADALGSRAARVDVFGVVASPPAPFTPGAAHSGSAIRARAVDVVPEPQPYSLPERAGLGAETVHRYFDRRVVAERITITGFVPTTTPEMPGVLLNLNAKRTDEIIPDRCIISDLGHTRAFIGVDKRPGTPLDRWLARIVAVMPRDDVEAQLEYLRTKIADLMRPAGAFPWDDDLTRLDDRAWDAFARAGHLDPGHAPIDTGLTYPVVPLERLLELGRGACIHKALVAALVLERLKVPCRIVNGAVAHGPGDTGGHAWVELADGRVLDPTWRLLQAKGPRDPDFPDRFQIGASMRFESQIFPYLRDL